MISNEISIERITDLITHYANSNSVDNKLETLIHILSNIKSNKYATFNEIAMIAGILNVSPDYIMGITDKKKPYDNMSKLLSTYVLLKDDLQESLVNTAKNYKIVQDNVMDFDAAGVNIIVHNKLGRTIPQDFEPKSSSILIAADESEEYISNKTSPN